MHCSCIPCCHAKFWFWATPLVFRKYRCQSWERVFSPHLGRTSRHGKEQLTVLFLFPTDDTQIRNKLCLGLKSAQRNVLVARLILFLSDDTAHLSTRSFHPIRPALSNVLNLFVIHPSWLPRLTFFPFVGKIIPTPKMCGRTWCRYNSRLWPTNVLRNRFTLSSFNSSLLSSSVSRGITLMCLSEGCCHQAVSINTLDTRCSSIYSSPRKSKWGSCFYLSW